jgi:hypothetical protein
MVHNVTGEIRTVCHLVTQSEIALKKNYRMSPCREREGFRLVFGILKIGDKLTENDANPQETRRSDLSPR